MTVAVLGPSGCGKTTLLRVMAGLEKPDSGRILYDGQDIAGVPTGELGIGMVFQNYALYPNLTTDENVMAKFRFGKRTPELAAEAKEKYERTSRLMGVELTDLMGRFPDHLSGGEKQRVAIARCITRDPTVFLMDEPFSNLDSQLRATYRAKLRQLLQHFGITTVYVTHDQLEARVLADMIAVMSHGQIQQLGSYHQLYEHPVNLFVAEFLNLDQATVAINLFDGGVIDPSLRGDVVGVRPEDVVIGLPAAATTFEATVTAVLPEPLENRTIVHASIEGTELHASIRLDRRLGSTVRVAFGRFHVFDGDTGIRTKVDSTT